MSLRRFSRFAGKTALGVSGAAFLAGTFFLRSSSTVASILDKKQPPKPQYDGKAKYRALVLGGSGATGDAVIKELVNSPHCSEILVVGRSGPRADNREPASLRCATHPRWVPRWFRSRL